MTRSQAWAANSARLTPVAIFVAILAILGLRSSQAIQAPVVAYEDGTQMLAHFFNADGPASILRLYNGYVSVLPNTVAWIATRGPLTWVPHIFVFASLIFAAVPLFLLTRPGCSWLAADARHRTGIALVIALLPIGKGYMIDNLTYSQWSLLLLLFLLVSQRLPSRTSRLPIFALAVTLIGCSHPLSILATPLCVVHFAIEKRLPQRVCLAACFTALLVYQLVGVAHDGLPPLSPATFSWGWKVFSARVLFETVFGAQASTLLSANGAGSYVQGVGLLIVLLLGAVTMAGARPKRSGLLALSVLGMAFAIVLLSSATRYTNTEERMIYTHYPYLQRYIYVPKVMFAALIGSHLVPRVAAAVISGRRVTAAIVLAACLLYVAVINRANAFLYESPAAEGERVRTFLVSAQRDLERSRAGEDFRATHTLPRGEGWSIVLQIGRDPSPSATQRRGE